MVTLAGVLGKLIILSFSNKIFLKIVLKLMLLGSFFLANYALRSFVNISLHVCYQYIKLRNYYKEREKNRVLVLDGKL